MVTLYFFLALKSAENVRSYFSNPFCSSPTIKPRNFVFSQDDEIRSPALYFVTLLNYHSTMTALETEDVNNIIFLLLEDSIKLDEMIDALRGPLGRLV